jgi:hypothetical protein
MLLRYESVGVCPQLTHIDDAFLRRYDCVAMFCVLTFKFSMGCFDQQGRLRIMSQLVSVPN